MVDGLSKPDGMIAAQGGWADNSKTGTATVVAEGSASAPNHLELSEGGAVHHEIGSWTETADRLAVEFAFKRKSSLSGRNLQVSLRDPRGNSGLFLNIRGSGTSLDAGLTGAEPAQFPFAEELPKDTWLRAKMEWSLLEAKLLIRVTSADGIEYLNQSFELPTGIYLAMGLMFVGFVGVVIVVHPGTDVDIDQLRSFLADKVAKWWIPERWSFVSDIPRTSVGKYDKKVIRARHSAGEYLIEIETS